MMDAYPRQMGGYRNPPLQVRDERASKARLPVGKVRDYRFAMSAPPKRAYRWVLRLKLRVEEIIVQCCVHKLGVRI